MSLLRRYMHWLHTCWPAGGVEKLPEVGPGGTTAIPGVRITGDPTGIPLLKSSVDSGARAAQAILAEPNFRKGKGNDSILDPAIVGDRLAGAHGGTKRGGRMI